MSKSNLYKLKEICLHTYYSGPFWILLSKILILIQNWAYAYFFLAKFIKAKKKLSIANN